MMVEKEFRGMKYLITEPEAADQKYPVILLLHGAGTRSDNTEKLRGGIYFAYTQSLPDFPFLTVAPLCSENTWFDMMDELKGLVSYVAALPFVDARRIYAMGASMGGYGVWQLAMSMPQSFAAIVPVCGGGMYWNAARLKAVPVWAFHGAKDKTVLVEESIKMVEKVNAAGGNAKLTVYPDNFHDAWTDTYTNPEVYSWLLEHSCAGMGPEDSGYDDAVKFG